MLETIRSIRGRLLHELGEVEVRDDHIRQKEFVRLTRDDALKVIMLLEHTALLCATLKVTDEFRLVNRPNKLAEETE